MAIDLTFRENFVLKKDQIILFLAISFPIIPLQADHDFNQILLDENISIRICGDLPYSRQRRNCTEKKGDEFQSCMNREKFDPKIVKNKNLNYGCINSDSTNGVKILEEILSKPSSQKSCMVQLVQELYGNILEGKTFRKTIQQYKKVMKGPVRLNYGIDLKNSVALLQMDYYNPDIQSQRPSINLSKRKYKNKGPCGHWNKKSLLKKMNQELSLLILSTNANKKFDPLEGKSQISSDIIDRTRSNQGQIRQRKPAQK
jgi:hypothetical protein